MQSMITLDKTYKPTFSGHETFPLKYGWIKKVFDNIKKNEPEDARKTFSGDDAIANFGVGKNMVSSMRHWALFTGIIELEEKKLVLSKFANTFFSDNGFDPWLENNATLWLIHWKLASTKQLLTYYWLFNSFNKSEFRRELLTEAVLNSLNENGLPEPSLTTLKRDVECLVRNYTHKSANKSGSFSEDNIESPLAELGIIKRLPHDKFELVRGEKPHLPYQVFIYVLVQFWEKNYQSSNTISLEACTYDPESPGRTFLLDEDAIISYAFEIEKHKAININWSETAGLRQFTSNVSINTLKDEASLALKELYKR